MKYNPKLKSEIAVAKMILNALSKLLRHFHLVQRSYKLLSVFKVLAFSVDNMSDFSLFKRDETVRPFQWIFWT